VSFGIRESHGRRFATNVSSDGLPMKRITELRHLL
jgi:hypothetical protein